MRVSGVSGAVVGLALMIVAGGSPDGLRQPLSATLSISPDNPHYFLWRGRPAVLIGSGEHYGALMNLDFDYRKVLSTRWRQTG